MVVYQTLPLCCVKGRCHETRLFLGDVLACYYGTPPPTHRKYGVPNETISHIHIVLHLSQGIHHLIQLGRSHAYLYNMADIGFLM